MRVGIRGSQSGGAGRTSRGSKLADNKASRRSPGRINCRTPKNRSTNCRTPRNRSTSRSAHRSHRATSLLLKLPRLISSRPSLPYRPSPSWPASQRSPTPMAPTPGKSVELTWSFLEKLAAVRSLDKAFEVQTEFAKQAFETFLAESRKIHELHSELTRQRVFQLEGFVARITQATFALRVTYP